jgi:hypothetical protein
MLRCWLVCGAALAIAIPSVRGEEGVPTLNSLEKTQKDILQKLNQIQNDIASLKDRMDRIESSKSSATDSYDIRLKLEELHADLLRVRSFLNGRISTSGFQSMPQPGDEPAPKQTESRRMTAGKVEIRNDSFSIQRVIVNDLSYAIAPGETRDIFVAPGEFTYWVQDVESAPRTSYVPAGMKKPIRIGP